VSAVLPLDGLRDPLPVQLPRGVHLLRSRRSSQAVAASLRHRGWAVASVDLRGSAGKADILAAFAAGLAVPTWVGRNWDALDDALRDLSWWPAGPRGRVIIARGASTLAAHSPREHAVLVDILSTAASRWSATATPLVVLLRR
jgi:hypothetical protein